MAENSPSAPPFVGDRAPAMRIVAEAAASRPSCPGRVTWAITPEREVSECVLPRGHRGDHRDGEGYPWNEGRWLD